jgi:predicted enzyme related to lactoylglutathione lyase
MLSTDFVTGSPNWLDLSSPDTAATAAFYQAVFGWDYQSAGPGTGGYGFLQKDGKTVAALGTLTEEGATPSWTAYFQTPDAQTTAKAVDQAGGTVRVEPFAVMDAGFMAHFTDPQGAEFAVFQPASVKGLDTTSEHDTLCWVELHTPDAAAALPFYHALFGWRSQEVPMAEATYTVLSTADGDLEETSFGGVAGARAGADSHWIPYFDVADADDIVSRVERNGGSLDIPAADIPGIGRAAWLTDPCGATFAVLTPLPQATA